jgi:hypothetical protein
MCIICLEYQKFRDLADARQMLWKARREPNNIEQAHLDEVETLLDTDELKAQDAQNKGP